MFRKLEKELAGEPNDSEDEDIPLSASSKIVADKRKQAASQAPPPKSGGSSVSTKATEEGKAKPKLRRAAAVSADATFATSSKPTKTTSAQTKKTAAVNGPTTPTPPLSASSKPAPKPRVKQQPSSSAAQRPGKPTNNDEVLEFGKPSQQSREARPQVPTNTFALPISAGSGGGLALPGPSSGGSDFVSLPGGPTSAQSQFEEEDDDDWDQVAGAGDSAPGPSAGTGTGADEDSMFGDHNFEDTMEEIDINVDQFAAEMDQTLLEGLEQEGDDEGEGDGEEDIFGDDMEDVTPQPTGKPMSLNEFAGGGTSAGVADGEDDDDDYTSTSEDSDDD